MTGFHMATRAASLAALLVSAGDLVQAQRPTTVTLDGAATHAVYLSSLDLTKVKQGFGVAQADRSVTSKPLSLAGSKYDRGVGTHAPSTMWVDLQAGSKTFHMVVGIDDSAKGSGSARFTVYGDSRKLWQSGVLRYQAKPVEVTVDVSGVRKLLLSVDPGDDGNKYDHADWADAYFGVAGEQPVAGDRPEEPKAEIMTPPVGPQPQINGPKVYGCRPGHPFLYRIPATGTRPMEFVVDNLPASLQVDASNGIISGTAPQRGSYQLQLHARNALGRSDRPLRIVSGDTLALTPYMGWNHWYMHYDKITDAHMRRAADAMISSGMADAGYSYVCIDDCWMNAPKNDDPKRMGPLRDEAGNIQPNAYFPDMHGLTDYMHAKGLKAGIYTSPGPLTCTHCGGTYQHEAQDAATFAGWGFDLLKYDWCSYGKVAAKPPSMAEMRGPYQLMGDLLLKQNRDIVYNLCQYGMGDVWEWGADVHAQSWRTAGDLGYSLDRIFDIAAKNAEHRAWQGPGHWNDPDYLQIGLIGDLKAGRQAKRGVLTPTEEYSFMSLWCLSAAPLVYSGDMDHLDAFTTAILCNTEAIEVNQDPLGQCATVSPLLDNCYLMVKDLEDGSKAIGLCNGSEFETVLQASWPALGIRGKHTVRDLWHQKDVATVDGRFEAKIPRHGVGFFRISKVR